MVPSFNLGRSRLSLLLEGQIDQRKHNHQANDRDGGGQQDKERSDHQATKHFPMVNLQENVHWGRKTSGPRLVRNGLAHLAETRYGPNQSAQSRSSSKSARCGELRWCTANQRAQVGHQLRAAFKDLLASNKRYRKRHLDAA